MEPYTLLVIARTQTLAKRLRSTLDPERYVLRWVPSTAQALALDLCPVLIVLALPRSGGVRSVARLKRRFDAPLLAIRREEGPVPAQVDAWLAHPYRIEQLVALTEDTLMAYSPHMVRAVGMSLDVDARMLQINGALHQLRPTACRILALLMSRIGTVVPRDELYRRVWNTDEGDRSRALDVHIAHLRRQIETDPRKPKLILTERGIGYRLEPPA
jgi:DNA-binding response OmpR family regulator